MNEFNGRIIKSWWFDDLQIWSSFWSSWSPWISFCLVYLIAVFVAVLDIGFTWICLGNRFDLSMDVMDLLFLVRWFLVRVFRKIWSVLLWTKSLCGVIMHVECPYLALFLVWMIRYQWQQTLFSFVFDLVLNVRYCRYYFLSQVFVRITSVDLYILEGKNFYICFTVNVFWSLSSFFSLLRIRNHKKSYILCCWHFNYNVSMYHLLCDGGWSNLFSR